MKFATALAVVATAGAASIAREQLRPTGANRTTPLDISMAEAPTATLYRMVLPDHTCPFGVRAKALLEDAGFEVDDRILRSRDEVDALEAELGVDTTPQVFIDGERIGGCDDLQAWLERR